MQHEKIVHDLIQGSDAWHAFRLSHFGASEAAAMLGLSTKTKRTELLHAKHTGIAKEFSDWLQVNVLDLGHEVEAKARPIIERIFGIELGPVTLSLGKLSASCDGITMFHDTLFEHKQWNEALAAAVRAKQMPDEHMAQCQQQLLVTGADRDIFCVSDGTEDNMEYMEVLPDPAWFARIEAGWDQFEKDLAEYVPQAVEVKPTGRAPETLPALLVEITGQVTNTNLPAFKAQALAVFQNINRDLQTDEDFADADKTAKWCQGVEDRLKAAKDHALSQTASIEELFRALDEISAEARRTRLDLGKLVEARKQALKDEIVAEAVAAFRAHIAGLNATIGKDYMPVIVADFGGAIKGLRSLASMRDAVATTLANAKIKADAEFKKIMANMGWLREHAKDYIALFADTKTLVLKEHDDFVAQAQNRITAHRQAEEKRLEAERAAIRAEEERKAQAAAQAEQDRIRTEAAAKARQELLDEQAARQAQQTAAAPAAVPTPAAAPAPAVTPVAAAIKVDPVPAAANDDAVIKLGDINARISPLQISAAGLAELGFEPVPRKGAAVYFRESDYPRICEALIQHLTQAADQVAA
jgi:predicted phage-related endonuclease